MNSEEPCLLEFPLLLEMSPSEHQVPGGPRSETLMLAHILTIPLSLPCALLLDHLSHLSWGQGPECDYLAPPVP